ncbi:MAG: iron-sulfur cluster carrier protein ApbC [Oceanococcus sp.]
MIDRAAIELALQDYRDDVIQDGLAGFVDNISFDAQNIRFDVNLPFAARRYAPQLRQSLEQQLQSLLGERELQVQIDWRIAAQGVQGSLKPLPGIKNIIAVASGKGGVGKSTVSANLALALAADGAAVGLLDADIYGPSQPRMLGVSDARPELVQGKMMLPVAAHGIALMSLGLLVDEEQPTIWRGPMVTQALHQMLSETRWPELDYLIIDMPPGTGDTQLSLAQRIPVSGAVIVTTPQDIALLDARKGLKMFEQVGVNVLGVVENMSTHICSQCGHEDAVFGSGGGEEMAQQFNVPLLGKLPLDSSIRLQADSGQPTVVADPDSPLALAYFNAARRSAFVLSQTEDAAFPEIVVE